MRRFQYYKSCIDHQTNEVPALSKMVDDARDVTLETVQRNCIGLEEWARDQGYERDKRHGLTLAQDWAVSFHRSRYNGARCYYIRWSAIEFIWLPVNR